MNSTQTYLNALDAKNYFTLKLNSFTFYRSFGISRECVENVVSELCERIVSELSASELYESEFSVN